MWYATMLTGRRPALPVGRGWIATLGALVAGRYERSPASSAAR